MPTNTNLNSRIRQSLYSLKREYGGGPFLIHTYHGTVTDLDTGEKVVSETVTKLRRVISLPARLSRELVQSISQISANKEFVYGGSYDARQRTFIIDRRDAPGLVLKDDDWFVFDGRKYEIKNIQEFEFDTAYVVVAKHLAGEDSGSVYRPTITETLTLASQASAILN